MEECDIWWGQNILWPLLHIFWLQDPNPRIYAPCIRAYTKLRLRVSSVDTHQSLAMTSDLGESWSPKGWRVTSNKSNMIVGLFVAMSMLAEPAQNNIMGLTSFGWCIVFVGVVLMLRKPWHSYVTDSPWIFISELYLNYFMHYTLLQFICNNPAVIEAITWKVSLFDFGKMRLKVLWCMSELRVVSRNTDAIYAECNSKLVNKYIRNTDTYRRRRRCSGWAVAGLGLYARSSKLSNAYLSVVVLISVYLQLLSFLHWTSLQITTVQVHAYSVLVQRGPPR